MTSLCALGDVNTNVNDVGGARSGSIYLMSDVNTNVNDVGGARSGSICFMSDVNTQRRSDTVTCAMH